jgi:hypothetical protein
VTRKTHGQTETSRRALSVSLLNVFMYCAVEMSATKCKPISMLPPLPCIILIQASNRGKDKVQTATSGSRRPLWQAASGRSKSRIDQLHRKPTCSGAGVSMDPFARLDCHFIAGATACRPKSWRGRQRQFQIHRYCGQWGRSQTTSACCRWRRRIPWAGCYVVRIARREFAWAP